MSDRIGRNSIKNQNTAPSVKNFTQERCVLRQNPMMEKQTRAALAFGTLFASLLIAGGVSAADRYIHSATGSDTTGGMFPFPNSCLSSTAPCATIDHAHSIAANGDVLLIAGDFEESVNVTKPITIEGRSRAVNIFGQGFGPCSGETGTNRCPDWRESTIFVTVSSQPSTLTINRVRFSDSSGSAVAISSGILVVENSIFRNNGSGAISADLTAGSLTIRDCLFEGNGSTSGTGGAISGFGFFGTLVERSVFRLNFAASGGAIGITSFGTPITNNLIVLSSEFDRNFAQRGGAIDLDSVDATIDATFRNNVASQADVFTGNGGGAIHARNSNLVVQAGSLFETNRAEVTVESAGAGARGGSIDVLNTELEIAGAEFRNNELVSPFFTPHEASHCGIDVCVREDSVATLSDVLIEDSIDSTQSFFRDEIAAAVEGRGSAISLLRTRVLRSAGDGVRLFQTDLSAEASEITDGAEVGLHLLTASTPTGLEGFADFATSTASIDASTLSTNGTNFLAENDDSLPASEHDATFVNSTISGGQFFNVRFNNGGSYAFNFSTVSASFSSAIETFETANVSLSDSIVKGRCDLFFGAAPPTFNLGSIWDDASCGFGPGLVADVGLMPLADNGGPTLTHMLTPSSPAREGGSLRCLAAPVNGVDQRGELRPEGTFCDSGAVEVPEPGFVVGLFAGLLALARTSRSRD